MLTVLDRLRRKGLVRRERHGRAHLYEAAIGRADYVADLMVDALGQAPDRGAALTRFLGSVTPTDTEHLRVALGGPDTGTPDPRGGHAGRTRADGIRPDARRPDKPVG